MKVTNKSKFSTISKKMKLTQSQIISKPIPSDFSLIVAIGDWNTVIYCGNGTQTLNWLFNYSLLLFSNDYAFKSGLIIGYLDSEGIINPANDYLNKLLYKQFNCYDRIVLLREEDYEKLQLDVKNSRVSFGSTIKGKSKSRSISKTKNMR